MFARFKKPSFPRLKVLRLTLSGAALVAGISTLGAFQFDSGLAASGRGLSSVKGQPSGAITHDAALYERIRKLDLERAPAPSFEDDLARLSSQESRHREKLPGVAGHPRLKSVIKRLSAGPYPARR